MGQFDKGLFKKGMVKRTCHHPELEEYEGAWENGARNGFGCYHDAKRIYTGNWLDMKKSGLAKDTWNDTKNWYIGNFVEG